jgi:hypothetical protein
MPHLSDTLTAYYDRRIALTIDDDKVAQEVAAPVSSRARPHSSDYETGPRSAGYLDASHYAPVLSASDTSTTVPNAKAQSTGTVVATTKDRFFTRQQVEQAAKELRVNTRVVSIELLWRGMEIEHEHGGETGESRLNVTFDSALTTARIALAHLYEFPPLVDEATGRLLIESYYDSLERLEATLDAQWASAAKPKPSIWLTD